MGARKQFPATGRQSRGGLKNSSKTRLISQRTNSARPVSSVSGRSNSGKSSAVNNPLNTSTTRKQETKSTVGTKQKPNCASAKQSGKKDSLDEEKDLSSSGDLKSISRPNSPKKLPSKKEQIEEVVQQQLPQTSGVIGGSYPVEDKSRAINKMLKSLDIKISGFNSIAVDEQKVAITECKASISEVVKTKSRAAATKSTGNTASKLKKDKNVINSSVTSGNVVSAKLSNTNCGNNVVSKNTSMTKDSKIKNPMVTANDSVENCSDSIKREIKPKTLGNKDETLKSACDPLEIVGECNITKSGDTIVFDNINSEKDKLEKEIEMAIPTDKSEDVKRNSCFDATNKLKKGKKNVGKEIVTSDSNAVNCQTVKTTALKNDEEKLIQQKQTQLKMKSTAKKNSNCSPNKNNEEGQERMMLSSQERNTQQEKGKMLSKSTLLGLLKENDARKPSLDGKGSNLSQEGDANGKIDEIPVFPKKGSTEVLILPPKKMIKNKMGIKSNEKGLNLAVGENKFSSNIEDVTYSVKNEKCLEVSENFNSTECITLGKSVRKDNNIFCEMTEKPQQGKDKNKFMSNEALSKTQKSSNQSQKNAQLKKNSQSRLLAVRERLQKKYVHGKLAGFKSFKTQNKKLEKIPDTDVSDDVTKKMEISSMMTSEKEKVTVLIGSTKHEKDVYDFKTESDSDDNIKMNLLNESRTMPKFRAEKEYSDEDDKPLHLTKLELKEEKDDKEVIEGKKSVIPKMENKKSTNVKKSPVKVREEKKTGKGSKKVTIANKRKEKTSTTSDGESDSSDSDESSKTKLNDFGQRRHRMASLNALAKVQCLYENESRTAHELGLSKSTQVPKMRLINTSGSEEEKDTDKKTLEAKEVKKEPPSQLGSESENKRELRNAPGLRGVGKHWDFDDVSTSESGHESDHAIEMKSKTKKRKISKMKATNQLKEKDKGKEKDNDTKEKSNTGNKTTAAKQKTNTKTQKKKARSPSLSEESSNSSSDDDRKEIANCIKKSTGNKRKRDKLDDIGIDFKGVLARKRMASLNASALVAATYDIERHLDRNFNSDCSSFESFPEDEKPKVITPPAKTKIKEIKKDKSEENTKDIKESTSRPTSSSVVIVQDTDVTITGVYVNSSTGSSQEAYCKMQYRVQSSVTEERVLRPNSIDPPKSYTPLGALSSMRPPGSAVPEVPSTVAPPVTGTLFQPSGIDPEQTQSMPNPHIYPAPPPTHRHPSSTMIPPGHIHPVDHSQAFHHHHHHLHQGQSQPPQIPLKYPHHHHLHSQQPPPPSPSLPHHPTPISQGRCESPTLTTSGHYPLSGYHPIQPGSSLSNPATISSGSSAFCPPIQQSHPDIAGYYQPAGPLISPHLLSSVPPPPSNASLVSSTKRVPSPLDSESDHHQLQQQTSSAASAGESSDSEVLITGGDLSTFRYPSQAQHQQQQQQQQQLSVLSAHQQQQQAQSQNSPYSRSMHQMHYPPSYPPSYYTPYPGDAMCYSPPYQPYFPAKVYQSTPAYRRYPYYQPGPPSDLYDPPPQSNAVAQSGSQLVPAGPAGPQHMEHYPGPPGFYSGYSPGGGQCYSRGLQPPYMDYPPPCPCPMQSCPKNVLTGPLIGSSNSGSSNSINNNTNTAANNNNISNGMNTINNNNNNPIMNSNSNNNSSSIMNHNMSNSNGSIFNNTNNSNSINHTSSSLKNLNQSLKTGKGPVQQHQQNQQLSPQMKSHNHLLGTIQQQSPISNESLINKSLLPHHHHMHQCKMELVDPMNTSLKQEITNAERMSTKDNSKENQYEEVAVPPTSPSVKYTLNDKLIEPEATVSPARGSTGLPTIPDQDDKAASTNPAAAALISSSNIPQTTLSTTRENIDTVVSTNMPSVIGRKARIGKSMAREMMYGAHALHHNPTPSANTIAAAAPVIPMLGGTPSSPATASSSVSLGLTPTSVQHQPPSLHHQHQMYSNNHNQYHHYHHHHILPSSGNNDPSPLTDPKTINEHASPIKTEMNKTIKQELIKTEDEDVVVILDDEKKIKTEPEIIEVFDDSKTSETRTTAEVTVETNILNSASINNNNNSNKAPQLSQVNCNKTVSINDFEDIDLPRQSLSLKRMKILELNKTQCKKSPPNGYKSLIKQTEPKPYLCLSKKSEHRKDRFMTITSKNGVRKRKLMLTEHQKKRLLLRKRKLMLLDKKRQAQTEVAEENKTTRTKSPLKDLLYNNNNINNNNNNNVVVEKVEEEITIVEMVSSQNPSAVKTTIKENVKELKSIDNSKNENMLSIKTIGQMQTDIMARGYFSEPEIITTKSTASNRRPRKTERISESRSKSETKKPSKSEEKISKCNNAISYSSGKEENKLEQEPSENNIIISPLRLINSEMSTQDVITPTFVIDSSNDEALVTESKVNSKNGAASRKKMKRHHRKPANRKASKSSKSPFNEVATNASTEQKNESFLEEHTALIENTTAKQTSTVSTTINNNNIVVLETNNNKNIVNSNNDSIPFEENLNVVSTELLPVSISPTETAKSRKSKQQDTVLTLPFLPLPQPTTTHKRARSRTKFGSRKRQRTRHYAVMNEVLETIIPRKLNVVPKWNNGWSWEGEPYQGKVFLNSDDPLVLRTCYPAMRHLQGDLVRPRDCVLLRAGSKRNELPYVAKVAHLWENPEDGEMMMSLLWYYRPEHTEQGRQANDCVDEVFASRHRDHNSVACIEDKCYVLTFSEYCRYRRSVRASEDGADEKISIVPSLQNYSNPREVPINTNPELVMFCQRVYDFRLKRLMKTPNNN